MTPPTSGPEPRVFFREALRPALLSPPAAYVHPAFFYVANLVYTGSADERHFENDAPRKRLGAVRAGGTHPV
jgi:hypothetical protein